MKLVKIKEHRPLMVLGTFNWYPVGHIFEVVAEKELPLMGLGYKLKDHEFKIDIEGWSKAGDFEVIANGII